jgi:hypothetical protein
MLLHAWPSKLKEKKYLACKLYSEKSQNANVFDGVIGSTKGRARRITINILSKLKAFLADSTRTCFM